MLFPSVLGGGGGSHSARGGVVVVPRLKLPELGDLGGGTLHGELDLLDGFRDRSTFVCEMNAGSIASRLKSLPSVKWNASRCFSLRQWRGEVQEHVPTHCSTQ